MPATGPDMMLRPDRGTVRLVHVTTVPESLLFLQGQAGYLKARGFDVRVISSPGEVLDSFAVREGVIGHAVEMPRRITPARDLVAVGRLCRCLHRFRPHIVHAHTPKGGLLGMIAAWLTGVPVRVYHVHGLPLMTASGWKRRLLRRTEKTACGLAHQVLCVSHSVRGVALTERLCPPEKIKVLLHGSINGVDAEDTFNPERFHPWERLAIRERHGIPADAPVVGYVGRLVRDKGLTELVGAWKGLREEFPELHLLVVGPFEPQDPLAPEVVEVLTHDPRIHLTGLTWEIPPLYAAMDLVVLPTYREGLPIVPLEAAAMALPVVATHIPGCVEAVENGVTGTLVPACDPASLAGAVREYLRDIGLRRRHGWAGRDRVLRDFRPASMHEALLQEYLRLIEGESARNAKQVSWPPAAHPGLAFRAVSPPPHPRRGLEGRKREERSRS